MTEVTSVNDVAVAWVEALTSRGVTVQARGKTLAYHPKSAYSEMSNEERATLRKHKSAIVAVVRERYAGTAGSYVSTATPTTSDGVASTTAPAPTPCRWCNRTPCIGIASEEFELLHPEHPDTLERHRPRATQEMLAQLAVPLPRWYTE